MSSDQALKQLLQEHFFKQLLDSRRNGVKYILVKNYIIIPLEI